MGANSCAVTDRGGFLSRLCRRKQAQEAELLRRDEVAGRGVAWREMLSPNRRVLTPAQSRICRAPLRWKAKRATGTTSRSVPLHISSQSTGMFKIKRVPAYKSYTPQSLYLISHLLAKYPDVSTPR